MNRLSLQDLRNLLIKKGRLLYGAVFLFCLVCFYGIMTSQWQRVSELSEGTEEPQVGNTADIPTYAYGANKGTRGGAVTAKGNQVSKSSDVSKAKSSKTKGTEVTEYVTPIVGLTQALRGYPFDDPFLHALRSEDMAVIALDKKGDNTLDRKASSNALGQGRRPTNGVNFNVNRRSSSYNLTGSGNNGNQYVSAKATPPNRLQGLHLTGIISGSSNLAMIQSSEGESCYGVGEGPQGIIVQTITKEAVLVNDGQNSRWLHVE